MNKTIKSDFNPGLSPYSERLRRQQLDEVREVTMSEVKYRARTGHGPVNLACLRNTSLSRLRDVGHKVVASALRTFATKSSELLKILSRFKN